MPNLMEKSRMIKSNSRESVATKQKEYNWGIDFLRIGFHVYGCMSSYAWKRWNPGLCPFFYPENMKWCG